MKKHLAILLTLSLLLALFAGCGNSGTSATTGSDSAETGTASVPEETQEEPELDTAVEEVSTADEAPAEAPMEVTLPITEEMTTYTLFTGVGPRVADLVDLNHLSSEYKGYAAIKEATNIDFDITAIAAMAYSEQFQLMVAGGDYCDVIYGVQDNYATNVSGALADEVIIDLYDLLKENAPYFNKQSVYRSKM